MQFKKTWLSLSQMIIMMVMLATGAWALSPLIVSYTKQLKSVKNQDIDNIKQIAFAIAMYTNDYDSQIPDSRSSAGSMNPSQPQVIRFLTAKPEDNLPVEKNPGYAQIIKPYLNSTAVLYSNGDKRMSTVSYWWKYAFDRAAVKYGTISINNILDPSEQIIIFENSPYYTGYVNGLKNGVKIAAAFLDGHVEEITIKNGSSNFPIQSEQISGEAAKQDGSPMFFNNRNGSQHTGEADYDNPFTDKDSF